MSSLYQYFLAVLPKWWAVVSACALFGLEPLVRAYWPWGAKQLERLSHQTRTRIEIGIFIAAIFYAGFSAWSDEREARVAAEQTGVTSPYRWRLLSADEVTALRTELRDEKPLSMAVLCQEDDCGDLARSLRDVFRDLHWPVMCCTWPFGGIKDGISVFSVDEALGKSIAQKIERATKGRLKVDIDPQFKWDPKKFPVQIEIGAKS